jgi:hypothetical protein
MESKKLIRGICYRCNTQATSDEHVPPKCLFPEQKDIFNVDFRTALIKVPSCDIHNTQKSKDDEFLMICIASSVQANAIGYFHLKTKVKRAIQRKYNGFMESIIKNSKPAIIVDDKGNNISVLKGEANIKRLNSCFKNIAYGLYFEEFKKTFKGKIKIVNDLTVKETKNQKSFIKLLEYAFLNDKSKLPKKGENPEIFYYQFTEPDKFGLISLRMTFYEGINIYVGLMPENSTKPFDLALALMNSGIKTTFKLGNEDVEFN